MDAAVIISDVVSKLNGQSHKSKSCLHLSISPALTEFQWHAGNFKNLIERFFAYALKNSQPKRPIRVAVHEMKNKEDWSNFSQSRLPIGSD
jgi:hypothetical protein